MGAAVERMVVPQVERRSRREVSAARRSVAIRPGHDTLLDNGQRLTPQAAATALTRTIRMARRAADNPPLAVLAAKLGYASASTMSRIFAGKAQPTMRTLENLAEALGVDKQTVVDVWTPLWEAAHDDVVVPESREPDSDVPREGFECHSCGSWVTNAARHNEWHIKIEYGRLSTQFPAAR